MRLPVCGSGQRAMSPAAKMPAALVSRYSSTVDAVIDRQARLLGEPGRRPHADAGDDEVGGDAFTGLERHGLAVDRR